MGLPFLKHNKIVINHETDTAIAKDSGFDLLHENKPIPLTTPPIFTPQYSPKQKHNSILRIHRQVLQKLKTKCTERRHALEENNPFFNINPPSHVAFIKDTIEHLASKSELLELEKNIKTQFKSIFDPIPHIDKLPPHKPAHIHLIDAYKKISTQS